MAVSNKATVILHNETNFIPNENDNITFFNCTTQRVPSTWFTWEANNKIIQSFKQKFPELFQYKDYDLTLAYQKALYWSNQKVGFLHYSKEKFFENEKVYKIDTLHPYKKWKVLLKYAFMLAKSKKESSTITSRKFEGKNAIFIKNKFQLSLYKFILKAVLDNTDFVVFCIDKEVENELKKLGFDKSKIDFIDIDKSSCSLSLINLFALKKEDYFVLNQIMICRQELNYWCRIAEYIAGSGVKTFLMNEGENGIFGAVMGEVMQKNGIKSFNTMNGMKAGQAQDAYINFDKWFVWDEQMKKLLVEKCKLAPDKLLVSGHLMEDEVATYKYQNSLGLDEEQIKGKKIISLFSVRGKREEKNWTFQYLYELASKNPELLLLVRPHPSESDEDSLFPPESLKNVIWIRSTAENSKTTLYDQLSISNLSVCFGSTVALESKWFGVPCITVEQREESLIYAVDGESIVHVRDKENLESNIEDLLEKGNRTKSLHNTKTAKCIVSSITA
ncbi:MAG: hypothetical protein J5I91_01730 [Bacteroidetes bacterium]|nr:hypothetical protein [Bacteroidota bacterium]